MFKFLDDLREAKRGFIDGIGGKAEAKKLVSAFVYFVFFVVIAYAQWPHPFDYFIRLWDHFAK